MWPRPKLRSPGVSISHPPPGSASATADDDVCRPRPVTTFTAPTARSASGIRALTSVDLPTPEWPTRTLSFPASSAAQLVECLLGQRAAEHDPAHAERCVDRQDRLGPGEIGLGQAEHGLEPGVVGGDQEPVDQPEPWRRVGERGDDHELVGVGDDRPLDRVGVIGRPAQDGPARLDPDDPGERAGRAADVAGQADGVTGHDVAAAELTCLHRGDDLVADHAPVPATVDGGDEGFDGLGVRGPPPGARPGAAAGPDPDVILVHAAVPAALCHYAGAAIRAQNRLNSGNVLPTVAALCTRRPSVTRPRTAAAITRR